MSDKLLPVSRPCYGVIQSSGYGSDSYPIEVGWSEPGGIVHAVIIRPEPDWTSWDPIEGDPHYFVYADLVQYGRPPKKIAQGMNNDLDGQLVFFDGGAFDQFLLDKLYAAAGLQPSFTLRYFDDLLCSVGCKTWEQRKAVEEYVGDSFSGPRAADMVRRLHSIYRDTQFVLQNFKQ